MYSGYPNKSSGAEFRDSIKTLDIKRLNHELSIRQTGMCKRDQRESAFQAKCLLIVEFAVVLLVSSVLFRSRKKFGYLCNHCFFSRPFNETFKFLKNRPYDFHKFCIVILHPKVHPPASAMASKLYNWVVGNSPNLPENDQKTATFQPFHFSENSSYDSNEISYSHSTPY